MVKFLPIKKYEAYRDGHLTWEYRSQAIVNGKDAGAVIGWSEQEVRKLLDYWEVNQDQWVSEAMRKGWL